MNAARRRRRKKRRMLARMEEKRKRLGPYLLPSESMVFRLTIASAYKCQSGSLWKPSVQRCMLKLMANICKMLAHIEANTYRATDMRKFVLVERGKVREISPVKFLDRIVQRMLCDGFLTPLLENSLIMDNSASRKGMGVAFARDRFEGHCYDHLKRYGLEGWVLQFDFSDFFHSISSEKAYQAICDYVRALAPDGEMERMLQLTKAFVMQEGGLGIGNHTSQLAAIFYASPIDHMFKEVLRVHGYGRYMDDGYAFFADRASAEHALGMLRAKSASLGLKLNAKKTTILRIDKPISYLKRVYRLHDDGIVTSRVASCAIRNYKRHYRDLAKSVARGKLPVGILSDSKASYRGVILSVSNRRMFKKEMRRWWKDVDEHYEIACLAA